jgi:hypothetical protein
MFSILVESLLCERSCKCSRCGGGAFIWAVVGLMHSKCLHFPMYWRSDVLGVQGNGIMFDSGTTFRMTFTRHRACILRFSLLSGVPDIFCESCQ